MRNLYDGRVLVIGNAQEQIDRTLKVADQQAPNAFHAFVVDPLMPADRALMVERSVDPDELHRLIFGPAEESR